MGVAVNHFWDLLIITNDIMILKFVLFQRFDFALIFNWAPTQPVTFSRCHAVKGVTLSVPSFFLGQLDPGIAIVIGEGDRHKRGYGHTLGTHIKGRTYYKGYE